MSATSSSDDPVQTALDLLSGTAAGDWPNGTKPDPIEEMWESSVGEKQNRKSPAAYVWSPEIGTREQRGAEYDDVVQTETIGVDVWSLDDSEAEAVASDVVAILDDYANDTRENTNWVTIRPTSVDDQRADALAGRRANQYVVSVSVELMRDDGTGT